MSAPLKLLTRSDLRAMSRPANDGSQRDVVKWRHHKCDSLHHNTATWLKCAIGTRRVLWVTGHGKYATVSWCGGWDEVTVVLYEDLSEALTRLKMLDRTACGGRCIGNHQIVEVAQ